jgi:TRAP-type C4-dicarboxylate transport system permease small subunit
MMQALAVIRKLANGIAISANVVGTLVVLVLVVIVNFDVVARGFFNAPFLGAVEVVQFSMVLIVFLQLPDVVRVDRLTASDGFLAVVAKRFPVFTTTLRRAINLLAATFMGLIAVAIYPQFIEMWHTNDYFGVPGVFTAPWWPIKLVILLSAGLCAILFALKVIIPTQGIQLVRILPEFKDMRE